MKQQDVVVIDANVIKGIFEEDITGSHDLTASPADFIAEIREQNCRVVLDDEGHIEAEWCGCVDFEWFTAWYSALAEQTALTLLSCESYKELIKKLQVLHGFPRDENVWLVKASATAAKQYGECVLATEDMDFYEPKWKKNAKERDRHLRGDKAGSVAKALRGSNVLVLSLCRC